MTRLRGAWWNTHGTKTHLVLFDLREGTILIANGETAKLWLLNIGNTDFWKVVWQIGQRDPNDSGVRGQIDLSTREVEAAFGLDEGFVGDPDMCRDYDADSAVEGKFVRAECMLNIPMPGTGYDGDPNISLYVYPELKAAVKKVIVEVRHRQHPSLAL